MAYITIHDRSQVKLAFEQLKQAKTSPRKGERWLIISYVINELMNITSLSTELDLRIWHLSFSILNKKRPLYRLSLHEELINFPEMPF